MEPFYFQLRANGKWHTAVAVRSATKRVIARCGITASYDRKNLSYRDTEKLPYQGGWCKQCQTTVYPGIPESY